MRRSLWDREDVPPIFMKGDVHGNAHTNILEVMSFRLGLFYPVAAIAVACCILMQILCVVSQKQLQLLSPTGAPHLDPAGGLPSQSSFMSPPIIL